MRKYLLLLGLISLLGADVSAQDCRISANLIPFYAKTRFPITAEVIRDTTGGFEWKDVLSKDSLNLILRELLPNEGEVYNARAYFKIDCGEIDHEVILDRSGRIVVDGTTYSYNDLLMISLLRAMPASERWRYLPKDDDTRVRARE